MADPNVEVSNEQRGHLNDAWKVSEDVAMLLPDTWLAAH